MLSTGAGSACFGYWMFIVFCSGFFPFFWGFNSSTAPPTPPPNPPWHRIARSVLLCLLFAAHTNRVSCPWYLMGSCGVRFFSFVRTLGSFYSLWHMLGVVVVLHGCIHTDYRHAPRFWFVLFFSCVWCWYLFVSWLAEVTQHRTIYPNLFFCCIAYDAAWLPDACVFFSPGSTPPPRFWFFYCWGGYGVDYCIACPLRRCVHCSFLFLFWEVDTLGSCFCAFVLAFAMLVIFFFCIFFFLVQRFFPLPPRFRDCLYCLWSHLVILFASFFWGFRFVLFI